MTTTSCRLISTPIRTRQLLCVPSSLSLSLSPPLLPHLSLSISLSLSPPPLLPPLSLSLSSPLPPPLSLSLSLSISLSLSSPLSPPLSLSLSLQARWHCCSSVPSGNELSPAKASLSLCFSHTQTHSHACVINCCSTALLYHSLS